MNKTKLKCENCNKEFEVLTWRIKQGRGRFCSKVCRHKGHSKEMMGENSPNWSGGIYYHHGHRMLRAKEHPLANALGYVYEHRLVMEKKLGRYLTKNEIIHHINGNKLDNRIENLYLTTLGEHNKIHIRTKHIIKDICVSHKD